MIVNNDEARYEPGPEQQQVPWLARVAVLGARTVDRRIMNPDGVWELAHPTVPLFITTNTEPAEIGSVTGLFTRGTDLFAAGTIDPDKVGNVRARLRSARLKAENLAPQLAFTDGAETRAVPDRWATIGGQRFQQPTVLEFLSARVGYVLLGPNPAYPQAWITVAGPVGEALNTPEVNP